MPRLWIQFAPAALLALGLVSGCGPAGGPVAGSTPSAAPEPAPAASEAAGEHGHKPGAHGGTIVEIGRDNYHAEAIFEKGGVVRVYLLGRDEAKVQEAEAQTLTAYARAGDAADALPFTLAPAPDPMDAAGKTSRFLGRLPDGLAGKELEVTVPGIRIGGDRFRFAFASVAPGHDGAVPAKVAGDDEKALYLTPGGKYTREDIRANGGVTASEKFQGAKARHDLAPRKGDKICPITLTKANPKFTWVIGGKEYQFCCPPCVDEFVRGAKENPEGVREPDSYVKP